MTSTIEPNADRQRPSHATPLEQGISLARAGDHVLARAVFRRMIHSDPYDEDAWLWLAWVAEDREHSLRYLQEAAALLPESSRIAEATRWARSELGLDADGERASASPLAARLQGIVRRLKPDVPARPERPAAGHVTERRPVATAPSPRPAPQSHEAADAPRRPLTVARPAIDAARLGGVAQRAGQGMAHALGEIKSRVPASATIADPIRHRLRSSAVPVASVVATVAMLAFVILGITQARSGGGAVHADELPPPGVDATPTPTTEERLRPLWVQVEVAWNRQAWSDAIAALERIREIDPRNVEARQRLAEACYHDGLQLVNANEMEQAKARLDAAIRLDAGNSDLQKARRKVAMYMDGLDAYWVRDWARSVETLKRVYAIDPDFRDARVMLGQAYYGYGVELQEERRWDESKNCLEKSLELLPEHPEAQTRLAEVLDAITPPRRIEVSLSDQLVTVYENHEPIRVFTVCTGRASAPTTPGRYEVLDKIPNAYGSKWDIFMPWWLGIYWAGGSENGFHGLPVTRAGVTVWHDRLGSPCSYGCIVLDTPDAIWLYEWVEVGTVVFVRR